MKTILICMLFANADYCLEAGPDATVMTAADPAATTIELRLQARGFEDLDQLEQAVTVMEDRLDDATVHEFDSDISADGEIALSIETSLAPAFVIILLKQPGYINFYSIYDNNFDAELDQASIVAYRDWSGEREIEIIDDPWLPEGSFEMAGVYMGESGPVLGFRLDGVASRLFLEATSNNLDGTVAVAMDEMIFHVAEVEAPIASGAGQIAGLSADELEILAAIMRSGPFPSGVQLEVLSVE